MERNTRSASASIVPAPDNAFGSVSFHHDVHQIVTEPPDNACSFTALLELPNTQAIELLHLSDSGNHAPPKLDTLTFPSNLPLVEPPARFSVFPDDQNVNYSPEATSVPSNSSVNVEKMKAEPTETEASRPLSSSPAVENQYPNNGSGKRKERENKTKGSSKKNKSSTNSSNEGAEQLPYVHVRARRGQATDSHSLAERARREKINARMKLLQELVPGCNKISGTALVLDEIINHVQSLQRQVEFLSMRLAAVNPRISFNLDDIMAVEGASLMDSNFQGIVTPMMWSDVHMNGQHIDPPWPVDAFNQPIWGKEENNSLISAEDSLTTALHSNQVKTEI